MSATLYLIPTPLGAADPMWLAEAERLRILHLRHFVVEAQKTARLHLKALQLSLPIRELDLQDLNEHTDLRQIDNLLLPLKEGNDLGLISEAGCPAIADPGAQLVARAHELGFNVQPLVGPSSILLALMASGANGQRFAFHGYLPVDANLRAQEIKRLEKRSVENDETQIFIETPYRNNALLEQCLKVLSANTRLCVACDLCLPTQTIISQIVANWHVLPALHKRPSIFLLYKDEARKNLKIRNKD